MTTASTIPNGAAEQLINHRLDVIDRALLDLLPRNERQVVVAQVESRVRELVAASAAPEAGLAGSTASPAPTDAAASVPGAWPMSPLTGPIFLTSAGRRRSRLAITAGLLGIAALVLLFATPVIYLVVGVLGEVLGEIAAFALMGIHVGIVLLGGLAAVALAIAALISLKRRRGSLAGHGWAIAGLCTGPLPIFAGAAAGLILGAQMLGEPFFSVERRVSDGSPPEASYAVPEPTLPAGFDSALPVGAGPVASSPTQPGELVLPQPAALRPIQPTANETPASEPETRPEPPGVPERGGG